VVQSTRSDIKDCCQDPGAFAGTTGLGACAVSGTRAALGKTCSGTSGAGAIAVVETGAALDDWLNGVRG
jgi:hypothetical protein